jgi:hypothetical protein
MNFDYTPKVQELRQKLTAFFDEHIYPNERAFTEEIAANRAKGNAWIPTELIDTLKEKARALACGTCSCRHRIAAPGSATWNTRPFARSWAV